MQTQPQFTNYKLRDVFNNPSVPADWEMQCFAPQNNPYVPPANPEYVFRNDVLCDVLIYLEDPQNDALFITGPTGSGKTSVILEIAARLNWPVQSVTAHGHLEFSDLIGHHTMVSEKPGDPAVMKFQYGPLAKAMAYGHIFVLNEADLVDPAELSGLNDILEGRPLVIEANGGKVIKPHPFFRFVATGNSTGSGDAEGLYSGVQTQNLAAMDRYTMIKVDYPPPEVELGILAKVIPMVPEVLRQKMVSLANDIRTKFKGDADGGRSLNVTLSTRKLVQWAKRYRSYYGAPAPLQNSLDLCLLNRCSPEEWEAINRSAELIFGQTHWPNRKRQG